jgi:DNA primase
LPGRLTRAGRAAALRAVPAASPAARRSTRGWRCCPTGRDPDSFARQAGAAALEELREQGAARRSSTSWIRIWFEERSFRRRARAAALREAGPMIASIADEVRARWSLRRFALGNAGRCARRAIMAMKGRRIGAGFPYAAAR